MKRNYNRLLRRLQRVIYRLQSPQALFMWLMGIVLFVPITAEAAPIFTILLTAVGMSGTALTITASILGWAATAVAGYLISSLFVEEPKDPGVRQDVATGEKVGQSFLVGYYATAGSLVYMGSWGKIGKTPNGYLTQIMCISDLPCTAMHDEVYIDDKPCVIDQTATVVIDGVNVGYPVTTFREGSTDWMWIKFKSGSQTTADTYLTTKFGTGSRVINSAFVGKGRCYVIVTTRYNRDKFEQFPSVLPAFDGFPLFDLRNGAHDYNSYNTHAFSANNKVIHYNLMRGIFYDGEWVFGGQDVSGGPLPAYLFDATTWTAAMNACDENISLAAGGTEKRFRMGAEIFFNDEPTDVYEQIDLNTTGRTSEYGGIYKTYVGAYGAAVYSFDDSSILATYDTENTFVPSQDSMYNRVVGSYSEPDEGWQLKAFKAKTKAAYLTEDNGQIYEKNITLGYTYRSTQAQRIALAMLKESRNNVTHLFALPADAFRLEPLDIVSFTSTGYQYTNKKFICGQIQRFAEGYIVVSLREINDADNDWVPSTDEDPKSVGVLDEVFPATQTLSFSANPYGIKNNAGTFKRPGLKLNWTVDDDDVDCRAVRYQVRLLDTSYEVCTGRVDFDEGRAIISEGIERNEAYQVRARIIPYSDRKTAWSAWQTVSATEYGPITEDDVDSTPPPAMPDNPVWLPTVSNRPQVTSDASRDEDGKIIITVTVAFVEHANRRINYEVRVAIGAVIKYFPAKSSPIEFKARSGIALDIRVRPISTFGVLGTLSAATTFTPSKNSTAPADPTNFTATSIAGGDARYGKIMLEWDYPVEADYGYTRIRWKNDSDFTGSTTLKNIKGDGWVVGNLGNNVTKYFWIQHFDTSGNPSGRTPAGNGRRGDTRRIETDDVGTGEIKEDNVGTNAVSRTKIKDLAVDTGKLDDLAVKTGKLDDEASTTAKIQKGAVTYYKSKSGKYVGSWTSATSVGPFQIFGAGNIRFTNPSGAVEFVSIDYKINLRMSAGTGIAKSISASVILYKQRLGSSKKVPVHTLRLSLKNKKGSSAAKVKTLIGKALIITGKPVKGSTSIFTAAVRITGGNATYDIDVKKYVVLVSVNKR